MEGQEMEHKKRRTTWRAIPVAILFVVVIPLVTFWTGKMTDGLLRLPPFPPFPWNLFVGPIVLFVGFGVAWGSIYQLYRAGRGLPWGDVDDPAQSTQLVTSGLYAYTRNPMILGFLFLLSGIGWVVQSISAILLIPLVAFILLWVWLKRREEPQLEKRFGNAYRAYKETTPLIIPRPWRFSRQTSEENH
jgi:protein-S-isoprenylcysteine O-methyltransferase Ste14